MNLLPVVFFWIIGAAMHHTQGHNSDSAGPYTLAFFATVAVMMKRGTLNRISPRCWNTALCLCATLFAYTLARSPVIIYADPASSWHGFFDLLVWGAFIFSALALVMTATSTETLESPFGRWSARAGIAAIALLFTAQIFVPLISPHPWIDVFVNNTRAVDHFLHGVNPYTQIYPDIYNGRYDYKPGFLYFPGLLFWLAPFRAIFGDIRYGYVFANFLIALGMAGIARKLKAPKPAQWIFPLLWLSFPVTFFVLEQSWIDTVLLAIAVLVFWSVEAESWILAGVLMGIAFSVKQYGFLVGAIATLEIWRRAGLRTTIRAVGAGAVVALALILPFAIADWEHFYASTITAQTTSAVRLDAYNMTSFSALDLHWMIPDILRLVISVAGITAGALYVGLKRKPELADGATALFFGYGTAFLFGKFAFCNYHYLLAGFLLLYLVGWSGLSTPSVEPRA